MGIGAAIGGIASGLMGMSSADKAADAQKDAAKGQAAVQRYAYDDTKRRFRPYEAAGANALAALQFELGLGERPTFGGRDALQAELDAYTGTPPKTYSVDGREFERRALAQAYIDAQPNEPGTPYAGFEETPGYGFAVDQGTEAIDNSAASRGGLFSGNTLKALSRFRVGLANQEYGNYLARLTGQAGMGQASAGSVAAAGQNFAQGTSNALANYGNAAAAGHIGAANAFSSGISNAISGWGYMNALNGGFQPYRAA